MKYREVELLNDGLVEMKNTGLKLETLKAIIKVKKAIKEYFDSVRELQIEIMKKYEVKETAVGYDYKEHPEKLKIDDEIRTAFEEPFTLPVEEFITLQELKDSTKDMSMIILDKLSPLIKDEEAKKEEKKTEE